MNTNFFKSLYSKNGDVSSKRFFGSLILIIIIVYLGFILFSENELGKLEYYCWTTAFITSAILVGGDTIKDLVSDIFNKFKK